MTTNRTRIIPGREAFARWQAADRSKPVSYSTGELSDIRFGPGRITLVGGVPGVGKTTFSMQLVFDALLEDSALTALICNVEMSVDSLFDRQLLRMSGKAKEESRAVAKLESISDRLSFMAMPASAKDLDVAIKKDKPNVVVLDYIQRIPSGSAGLERRADLDAVMGLARIWAMNGSAVITLSAISRSKAGNATNRPTIDCFRESSELEYGADEAYVLYEGTRQQETITVAHLKSRNGETQDLLFRFDRERQLFSRISTGPVTAVKRTSASKNPIPSPKKGKDTHGTAITNCIGKR